MVSALPGPVAQKFRRSSCEKICAGKAAEEELPAGELADQPGHAPLGLRWRNAPQSSGCCASVQNEGSGAVNIGEACEGRGNACFHVPHVGRSMAWIFKGELLHLPSTERSLNDDR